jgi:hypothetical protein
MLCLFTRQWLWPKETVYQHEIRSRHNALKLKKVLLSALDFYVTFYPISSVNYSVRKMKGNLTAV